MPKQYYSNNQTYVGWWANTGDSLGIATTDGIILEGLFRKNTDFPNNGKSWVSPASSEFTA
jgi:hypothetical protein